MALTPALFDLLCAAKSDVVAAIGTSPTNFFVLINPKVNTPPAQRTPQLRLVKRIQGAPAPGPAAFL